MKGSGLGIFLIMLGGFVWWNPDTIYLTSNAHPMNWYDYSKRQDKELALRRRFTKILEFTEDDDIITHTAEGIKIYWPIKTDGTYKCTGQ